MLISTIIPRSRYDHAVVGNARQQKIKCFVILGQHPPLPLSPHHYLLLIIVKIYLWHETSFWSVTVKYSDNCNKRPKIYSTLPIIQYL